MMWMKNAVKEVYLLTEIASLGEVSQNEWRKLFVATRI
jgi:hypothetical protein